MTENENEDTDAAAGVSLQKIEVKLWRITVAKWTQQELAHAMGIDVAMVIEAEDFEAKDASFFVSREFEKIFSGK